MITEMRMMVRYDEDFFRHSDKVTWAESNLIREEVDATRPILTRYSKWIKNLGPGDMQDALEDQIAFRLDQLLSVLFWAARETVQQGKMMAVVESQTNSKKGVRLVGTIHFYKERGNGIEGV